LLGYDSEEIIGKTVFDFMRPNDAEKLREKVFNIFASHEPFSNLENTNLHKNGNRVLLETSGVPFFDDEGNLLGYRGIDRDLTERKKAEEEKRRRELHFLNAQKMETIATLAGGIAHEFNNALSVLVGHIELLEMNLPDHDSVNLFSLETKESIQRLSTHTQQLLAYARGGKYCAECANLRDFILRTLPIIKPSIDSKISIETDFSTPISNVNIDTTQMQMVLSAILKNSSESMDGQGHIRITTEEKNIDKNIAGKYLGLKPGCYVTLIIEDDGRGMDEETRQKMFEPFYTTNFQGRGLGMAATYGIIKNHDGFIYVDSEIDRGTVTRIFLPPA
jgi:two-component system, cell cycle sensor histidine kinase and response regulator CckA